MRQFSKEHPMNHPKSYQFDLPSAGRPAPHALNEKLYPGVEKHWEAATSRRIFDPIYGVNTLVIHATAGFSSEGAMSVMRAHKASWHWLVPDEDEPQHGHFVWACAPEARAAWHVRNSASHRDVNGGKKRVNHFSLGVEIVNSQGSKGADAFSEWQIEATAAIARYCWAKYPHMRHVVSHARLDPGHRSDPGSHFPWEQFRSLVLQGGNVAREKLVALAKPLERIAPAAAGIADCCGG
jgi:N-acetylmuramoyl-L-alanine amidase